jgi:hypothetical protein
MKVQKSKRNGNRRGSVLAFVLIIGICLSILGWGMLQMGFGSRVNSAISVSGITAREAADAGIAKALYSMNVAFPNTDWEPTGSAVLPNSNASYEYTISSHGENYLITSRGISDRGQKVVYAITGIRNLFDYALIVNEKLVLKAGTTVDWYASSGTPPAQYNLKIGTNSIISPPAGGIDLGTGSVVNGDVLVGIGGDPDVVIREGGGGAITGLRYSLTEPFVFQQINAPTSYDATITPPTGTNSNIIAPVGYTLENPYTIETSSISIGQSGRLTVVGHVALHVTGDMSFGQAAELYVGDPNVPPDDPSFIPSSLDIYLDGNLYGQNAGGINNLSQIPGYFKLLGTGDPYQHWDIKNSRTFYGVYYGPNADIIIRADADIYGSVSGHSYDMRNNGNMHYDVELADLSPYDIGFGIDRWWEETGP